MPMSALQAPVDGENTRGSEASGEFAAGAASTWRAIDAALSPVIGQRGVVMLYQRSVHRASAPAPCLQVLRDEAMLLGDFGPLQALFTALPITEAIAANDNLLQTFYDLLASLIGPLLTERLLRSVSATLKRDHAVTQDRPS